LTETRKNILVTGGAGFIGSHLVGKLLSENTWNVTVADNFDPFYPAEFKHANISGHLKDPHYKLYESDIRDFDELKPVFEENNFDCIVHLAARAGVRPSLEDPCGYAHTNIAGTMNLLKLAQEHEVSQFVFGSSSSVYGNSDDVPFREDVMVSKPISPYAATKATGELLCHTFSHLYNIRTVCLRFFTVYGARQRPDLAIRKFATLIFEGKPIPVFGDGLTRRDYTYIDDIISGIRASIDYDGSMHEIFNLGESQTVQLFRLIELLEENLDMRAVIDRQPMQPGDVPQTFADITKARKLLGYNPQTKIEEGIKKFVEWFIEQRQEAVAESSRQ
jgi:UDP-glucuronate 4-epimerase